MIAKQIDNFFEYPDIILNETKKIKLYTRKEHPDYLESKGATWPGLRSLELGKSNPLLKYFCAKYLHLNNINFNEKSVLYVHCRPSNKNAGGQELLSPPTIRVQRRSKYRGQFGILRRTNRRWPSKGQGRGLDIFRF